MYKNVWCTCEVVVLLIKLFFLRSRCTSASLDLKVENGKRELFPCIRVVWTIKLRLTVTSTNLENRGRERQRKRESRRQASEAQPEKGQQRSSERDKQPEGDIFFVGRTTWQFCGGGEKIRNASGHQCTGWNWAAVKKKSEREHVRHFLHKACN